MNPEHCASERATGAGRTFEVLYLRVRALLVREIEHRYHLSRTDSEDVVQDAFLSFWLKRPVLGSPLAWLRLVTCRRAIDFLRRKKLEERAASAVGASNAGADSDRPETRLLATDLLERLSGRDRRLVCLHYFLGEEETTACRAVGLSPASAHRTFQRIRSKIYRSLQPGGA